MKRRMPKHTRRAPAVAAMTLAILIPMTPASAAQPPLTVDMAEPSEGGAILVERTAGETTGQPDGWRMNQDIWVTNTGPDELILEKVDISYTGGSDPADVSVDVAAFQTLTGFYVIAPNADEGWPGNTVPVGTQQRIRVPEERVHPYAIADSVTVELTFAGFDPVVVTMGLAEYVGDSPLGSLAFPGAAKDLAPGEYWTHGTGHQLRDHHRNQFWERHAEDWGVSRWDGIQWVGKTDDPVLLGNGDWNDDYLIWGKGLYATAPGEIVRCANGHPDDSSPGADMPGVGDYGNFVWIDIGDSLVLTAHIQQGTMPDSICPSDASQVDQTPNPPTPVEPGQFLGRVGNSGNTSNAHLHIDVQRIGDGQGLPLLYHNTLAASSKAFTPPDPPPFNTANGAAISMEDTDPGVGMLVQPEPRANVTGTIVGHPEPVVAGTQLTYDVAIQNQGPDAAADTTATIVIPSELDYVSDDGGCVEGPPNTLTCDFNMAALGPNGEVDEESFSIVADVPADLVHNNGGPVEVEAVGNVSSSVFDDAEDPFTWTSTVVAEADLEIVSYEAQNPPSEITIGQPASVTLEEVITNHGPSAPMDVRIDGTASADAGSTVAPTVTSSLEPAVGIEELGESEEEYTLSCEAPGPHTFTFKSVISPDRIDDTDPLPGNNTAEESFTVECIVPVVINIKPGSFENPLNLKSNGVIPLAILTTMAGEYGLPTDFDALTVHATSVRFGPEGVVTAGGGASESHGLGHIEDALERTDEKTRDGDLDMVLHFRTQESELDGTETMACVRGTFGPMNFVFHGCDVVDFVH
ncbi:MAG: hypothetical protein ACRDH9_12430 [Actinomycetota bacterium]